MKTSLTSIAATIILAPLLNAQSIATPAPDAGSTTTIVTQPAPAGVTLTEVHTQPGRRLERAVVTKQLSIAPRIVEVPPAIPVVSEKTTTTTTTTAAAEPTITRIYIPERNVVTVRTATQSVDLPYLTLPVLFVVDTDELLDQESRIALEETAAAIKEILAVNPSASFDIEGHTSAEGADDHNMQLSAARAQRIFAELTAVYGVPATAFTAHGYGEMYVKFPLGTEDQLQQDRRVLVVRTK